MKLTVRPPRRAASDSGVALVIVLLVLTALTMSALGLFAGSHRELEAVAALVDHTQCVYTADLGAQEATARVPEVLDDYYQSAAFYPTTPQSVSAATIHGQRYTVTATGGPTSGLTDLFAQRIDVLSTCTGRNGTRVQVRVGGQPEAGSVWETGLCACSDLDATSMFSSDSYSSDAGTYGSQPPGTSGNVGSNGNLDVGSNLIKGSATATGDLSGTATVTQGSRAGGTNSNGGAAHVSPVPHPCSCDDFDVESHVTAAAASNDDASAGSCGAYLAAHQLVIGGNDVCTLPGGTYYLTRFTIGGSARVDIGGPVTIYLHGAGPFDLGGNGILNTSDHARQLKIYSDSTADLGYHGTVDLAAYIYAPYARFLLQGNVDMYGGAVADEVELTGTPAFHWDQHSGTMKSYVKGWAASTWAAR